MHEPKKIIATILYTGLFMVIAPAFLQSCQAKENKISQHNKLKVVTSLFPLYDFARNIGQSRADVSLLLPPGLEAHSFEPKPGDMLRLNQSDVFIYNSSVMEPWTADLLRGTQNRKLKVIEAGGGIIMIMGDHEHDRRKREDHRSDDNRHEGGRDPHIWLDFSNAAKMADHILAGFIEKDPVNRDFYQKNAEAFKAKLENLDREFREGLSGCRKNVIVHGGHAAFAYLAQRYGLRYMAVLGFSPNAEPTPVGMIRISETLKANGLNHLFHEELLSPRIAQAIARETRASLLMLHAAHNVSKDELERGIGFMELMRRNLHNLRKGLQCPQP